MRRVLAIGWVCVLFAALGSPAHAGGREPIRGGFDAQAVPLPLASVEVDGHQGCVTGEEGVHKTTHRFEAPWPGLLIATLKDFDGDWDLFLLNEEGDIVTRADSTSDTPSSARWHLDRGDSLDIAACNFAGGPSARVEYRFVPHRKPKETSYPGGFRSDTIEYTGPHPAFSVPRHIWLYCAPCVSFPLTPGDRFVNIDIEDDSGMPVAAHVYQWTEHNGYFQESICGETPEPVEIVDGALMVGIDLLIGPCDDGTPAFATTGTITANFVPAPKH